MRAGWLILLLAICSIAMAGETYRLEFKDQVGAQRKYKTSFSMDGCFADTAKQRTANMSMAFTTYLTEKVLQNPNGTPAHIQQSISASSVSGTFDGKKIAEKIPAASAVIERTARGATRVIATQSQQPPQEPSSNPMMSMGKGMQSIGQMGGGFEFPLLKLAIGDSWGTKRSIPFFGPKPITLNTQNKLAGSKIVNGKTYLVINSDMVMTMPSMSMSNQGANGALGFSFTGKVTTLFDQKAGEIYRSNFSGQGKFNMSIAAKGQQQQVEGTMNMTGSMVRVL